MEPKDCVEIEAFNAAGELVLTQVFPYGRWVNHLEGYLSMHSTSSNKIVCPRCGQDYIKKALLKPMNSTIYICPECEAFWPITVPISKSTFDNFRPYMESKGFGDDYWEQLQFEDT